MPGRGQLHTLNVKKEAMAPHIIGGLTGGMAHGGHICHENYEFTSVGGLAPMSVFSRNLDLCYRDLDLVVYSGRTLKTTHSGSITEYTYVGGPIPTLITNHG
jgi:hypothetical protein